MVIAFQKPLESASPNFFVQKAILQKKTNRERIAFFLIP